MKLYYNNNHYKIIIIIIIIIILFLFVVKIEYKKSVVSLKNKAALAVSNQHILDATRTVQIFVRNIFAKRKLTKQLLLLQKTKRKTKEYFAANILQKLVRGEQ